MAGVNHLVSRVQEVYAARGNPPLLQLVHPSTLDALELSSGEAKALCGMLLAAANNGTGSLVSAQSLAEMKAAPFVAAIQSLVAAELVVIDLNERTFDLGPAERVLRVESTYELEQQVAGGFRDPWEDYEEPPHTLVLRPLKDMILTLARSSPGARGLARVYSHVFGRSVNGNEWAMLGAISKALGTDQAALLILENATQPWPNPLSELMRFAKARERGFASSEEVEAGRRQQQVLERAALKQRMQRWWRYGSSFQQVAAYLRTLEVEGQSPKQTDQDLLDARRDFAAWELNDDND